MRWAEAEVAEWAMIAAGRVKVHGFRVNLVEVMSIFRGRMDGKQGPSSIWRRSVQQMTSSIRIFYGSVNCAKSSLIRRSIKRISNENIIQDKQIETILIHGQIM